MAEIMFYHLEHKPWEQVLPKQLSTALERGWRCVVQAGREERVEEISELLWKNDADIFLTHGSKADGMAEKQPIWLTAAAGKSERGNGPLFCRGRRYRRSHGPGPRRYPV